ncbi:MAG: D-alanyl-D-alanine carboxypeptidase family protein [bacterium]
MKRSFVAVLVVILAMASLVGMTSRVQAATSSITADAAVLLDARTGTILYGRSPYERRPPASTTKILTAIVALEKGYLSDVVTVSPSAAWTEGSSIYLRTGEKLTLEALLWGALMESGNDACVAIAEHIAGSEKGFSQLQNAKARALGAWDTHFVNPHGLPDPDHYTSAYDLATIARYSLRNSKFQEIVRSQEQTLKGPEGSRTFYNTNRLLWSYSGADGVKTGTTAEAGQCLVASATRAGRQLVAVVLHSDDRWSDAIALLDYGFQETRLLNLFQAGEVIGLPLTHGFEASIPVRVERDLYLVVDKDAAERVERVLEVPTLRAPVERGERLGRVVVKLDGKTLAERDLVAAASAAKRSALTTFIWYVYRPLVAVLKSWHLL